MQRVLLLIEGEPLGACGRFTLQRLLARLGHRGADMRKIALCAVALLPMLVIAACSQSAPTPYPTYTPRIVTATPGPTSTPWIVTATPAPSSAAAPRVTATPPAIFIPTTPSGPGICGRTPEVQQALIEVLKITSCRLITEHELYRITGLTISAPELRAEGFAGLVNLASLRLEVRPPELEGPGLIPEGTLAGSQIKHLTIGSDSTSDTQVTFENGAFDGAYVESLHVSLERGRPVRDQQGQLTGYRASGRLPKRLPESLTDLSVSGDIRWLDWRVFQTLPELETLSLTHDEGQSEETPTPYVITLPTGAFAGNAKLRSLKLEGYSPGGTGTYRINAGLLAKHERLSQVSISKLTIQGPQPDGFPIRLHPDSPAASYVAEQGTREWNYWEGRARFPAAINRQNTTCRQFTLLFRLSLE